MPSLDQGDQHLVQVLRAHMGQLYAAALLAAFAAVLTRLVPEGSPGWGLLRVALAGCLITQAMVATGASSGLAGLHAAAGNAGAGLAALGWRGLWLTYLASAVPTIVFTVTGCWGCGRPGCPRSRYRPWAGCRRRRTCWCCARWPSAAPSRSTGSSPGSSRLPPSSGSSPWPPPCHDRVGQPPLPPSKLVGDQGHGRSCSYVTHHPARTLPTPGLQAHAGPGHDVGEPVVALWAARS